MNIKLTSEEKKLIIDNMKYLYSYINKNYNVNYECKQELINQGIYEIIIKIKNYNETQGEFYLFMRNILKHNLKNYYFRYMLNMKTTTDYNDLSAESKSKNKDQIEEYDFQFGCWEENYKEFIQNKKEWELKFKESYPEKAPKKPIKKQYIFIPKKKENTDIDFNIESLSNEKDNTNINHNINIKKLEEIVLKYNPIKQHFYKKVFIEDNSCRTISKDLNVKIKSIVSSKSVQNLVVDKNILKDLNCDINILKKKYLNSDPIHNYICSKLIDENTTINEIYNEIKVQDGSYYKNKIIEDIEIQINRRFK